VGNVKDFQKIDAEKCDYVNNNNTTTTNNNNNNQLMQNYRYFPKLTFDTG